MATYSYQNRFRLVLGTRSILGVDLDLNVVSSSIPSVGIGSLEQISPNRSIPWAGDFLTIDDLTVTFVTDEKLSDWKYIYKWMYLLRKAPAAQIKNYEVDASFVLLSNKNNTVFSIDYLDVFPVSLASIDFSSQMTSADPITVSATFKIRNIQVVDTTVSDVSDCSGAAPLKIVP